MREYQQADPKVRRQVVIVLVIVGILGVATLTWLHGHQEQMQFWLEAHLDEVLAHPEYVGLTASVFILPLLGLNLYLWRFCRHIIKSQRFPPPGTAVTRKTLVLTGSSAVYRARLMQSVVVIMSLAACSLPFMLWYIISRLAIAY